MKTRRCREGDGAQGLVKTTHTDQKSNITHTTSHNFAIRSSLNMQQPQWVNPLASPSAISSTENLPTVLLQPALNNGSFIWTNTKTRSVRTFLPSRKCSVMLFLVFTGRYQTRPVGWSRQVAGLLSVPGHVPGQAAPLQEGSPGQGGGRPDHGPAWVPYPSCPLRNPLNGRNGSSGLGEEGVDGEAGEAEQLLEAC